MRSTTEPATKPRARLSFDRSWWLTMLGIFVALGVMVIGAAALIASRNDAWSQAQKSASNLALALDRDITRNIAVLDLSLVGVIEALAEPGMEDVSPAIRQHALFDRSATAEDLGSILVLGTDGLVSADSTSTVPHRLYLGDRDYFLIHQHDADAGLFISRAFQSRLAGGDYRFSISRRISKPDGTFDGVVSATLRLNFLRRLFEALNIGKRGAITLLRADGRVLFRYPFRPQDVDADMASRSSNYARFRQAKSGQYVALTALDGVERLITFRQLGHLPLILTVSLSTDEILKPWWRKTLVIGPAMLLLCASSVASSLLFRREMTRRTRSEQALAEANQQLEVQASTDGLTGLMNRRAFDAEFDRAFRVAIRGGTPIALLMIDADHFKRFNDTYGHVAGDEVLRAVAACLGANLRRPNDRSARYGGEEFVAILPETDAVGACGLAEWIRLAVKALHIDHAESPIGTVSISIGVAATTPLIGDTAEDLLQRADQSLYAAKQGGRDRVYHLLEPEIAKPDFATVVRAATTLQSADISAPHDRFS